MFQRWKNELTSALQLFWVNMITYLEKRSKLLSLRDTTFIDARQQSSKLLEVSTELLSFRESRYYNSFVSQNNQLLWLVADFRLVLMSNL